MHEQFLYLNKVVPELHEHSKLSLNEKKKRKLNEVWPIEKNNCKKFFLNFPKLNEIQVFSIISDMKAVLLNASIDHLRSCKRTNVN